jgi:DNA-binding FadR family transcriptional regulator
MKAMFANPTTADLGGLLKQERRAAGLSKNERRAAERRRVYALFEEIQIAIHHGDRARVDDLMTELAIATGKRWRAHRSARSAPAQGPDASSVSRRSVKEE